MTTPRVPFRTGSARAEKLNLDEIATFAETLSRERDSYSIRASVHLRALVIEVREVAAIVASDRELHALRLDKLREVAEKARETEQKREHRVRAQALEEALALMDGSVHVEAPR